MVDVLGRRWVCFSWRNKCSASALRLTNHVVAQVAQKRYDEWNG